MDKERVVSKLKQARGLQTRENIVDAAERYFRENGYFDASIRKLAEAADVSVGSIYFYFKDKDEILLEVTQKHNERFIRALSDSLNKTDQFATDKKAWLRDSILNSLETYGNTAKFRAELKALTYVNPQIALQRKQLKEQEVSLMLEAIKSSVIIDDIKVMQPKAALFLIIDIVDATYDRIANGELTVPREEIIEECIDAIYKYLFL
jgi:Transcriptional regulator